MTLVDSGNARDNGLTLVSHFFESMDEMPHSWTLQHSKEVAKQTNGYDCGVHMCQNAADVAYDLPFSCSPNKVHAIRKAMTFEILTGALMPRE
ncbi:hypothetical protein DPMN_103588 [Dreissena polymorpha]|uniref:Ubiquitin-like protease family profile domain-containing protein n=1 Tax=Dreissena polymorpha TaxID=45954 RepID=A0A9D4K0B5_DREPO|nr:hypothetical protein DPMN_103588 [Dreissena polymorpha]